MSTKFKNGSKITWGNLLLDHTRILKSYIDKGRINVSKFKQIKVEFVYNKGRIKGIKIKGHTDVEVCNSISGIFYYLILGASKHCKMEVQYQDTPGDSWMLIKGDWIKASFIDMIQTFKLYIEQLKVVYKDKIIQEDIAFDIPRREVEQYIKTH